MNNYVVSDIHGNAERLEALLFLLRKKHPVGDYKLYVMGDSARVYFSVNSEWVHRFSKIEKCIIYYILS